MTCYFTPNSRPPSCRQLVEENKLLKAALKPFVKSGAHTKIFLDSRKRMNPTGVDLYDEDVNRARKLLSQ